MLDCKLWRAVVRYVSGNLNTWWGYLDRNPCQ